VPETLIALGKLVNVHAMRGELRMLPFNPDTDTLRGGSRIVVRRAGEEQQRRVRSVRRHKRFVLLTIEGCDSLTAAEALVGSEVCVPERDLSPPGPGEIYHYQLIGMAVVTTTGTRIGTVADVLETPSNAVCVVRQNDKEYLVPLIADVVRAIERHDHRLVIEPLPGLLDD
jgi:16S rRNA processing protein RimM